MNKLNKILILFFIIIISSVLLGIAFIESEYFGDIASRSIQGLAKNARLQLSFRKINFELLPPRVSIEGIKVSKADLFEIKASTLTFSLNPLDSLESDINLDNLRIHDGYIRFNKSLSDSDDGNQRSKDKSIDVDKLIGNYLNKSLVKIRSLSLEEISVYHKEYSVLVHSMESQLERSGRLSIKTTLFNNTEKLPLEQLNVDLSYLNKRIKINKVEVLSGINKIALSGEGIVKSWDNLKYSYSIGSAAEVYLPSLHNFFEFRRVGNIGKGVLEAKCNLVGDHSNIESECGLLVQQLESSFIDSKKISAKVIINNKSIVFKDALIRNDAEKISLVQSFEFYNFRSKKFVEEPIVVEAENLELDNALKYLGDSLKPLKGKLTGKIKFTLGPKDFHFEIVDNAKIQELRLTGGSNSILSLKMLELNKSKFSYINNQFQMSLNANSYNTKLKAQGSVTSDLISFQVADAKIDLNDFGKFSGFDIKGDGKLNLNVFGPPDNVVITINSELSNLSFEQYRLNKAMIDLSFLLSSNIIKIEKLRGLYGKSKIDAVAMLNYETLDINAAINHELLNPKDAIVIYSPLLKNLSFIPPDIFGDWKAKFLVQGRMTLEDLLISGNIFGRNTFFYDETIDSFKTKFELKDQSLSFSQIELQKGSSKMFSNVDVLLSDNETMIKGFFRPLRFSDFSFFNNYGLDLNGTVSGEYALRLLKDDLYYDLNFDIKDTYISQEAFDNSKVRVSYNAKALDFNLDMLGSDIKAKGLVHFTPERSSVDLKVNFDEINKFFKLIPGIDLVQDNILGNLRASANSDFQYDSIEKMNLNFNLEELRLVRDDIDLNYSYSSSDEIVVKDGEIKKWLLELSGKGIQFISEGNGLIYDDYSLGTSGTLNASILNLFNRFVTSSLGELKFEALKTKDRNDVVLFTDDLQIDSPYFPSRLKDSDILLVYKDNGVRIQKGMLDFTSGNAVINGDIDFSSIKPEMNIDFRVTNLDVPVLDKSVLTISSKGSFSGVGVPYTISGDVNILKGLVTNELNELSGRQAEEELKVRFLPQLLLDDSDSIFRFNLAIETLDSIKIVNTNSDLSIKANLQLSGNEIEPKVLGKAELDSSNQKVRFKNNDFTITNGAVFFYEDQSITNPEIDFTANTTISDYSVNIKAYGKLEDYKIDFSSEPSLSPESIFSLIAFGYTDNYSDNLSESDKESLTRAGVGSILFDSFRINETLKSEFGIQVNLGSEIARDDSSYLDQVSTDSSQVADTRVRSATKLEVQKKVSDAMSMSVSSTVGGSIGQRQTMNINLKVDEQVSLEGVYERNTALNGEQDNLGNSIGADLKFRWSFK